MFHSQRIIKGARRGGPTCPPLRTSAPTSSPHTLRAGNIYPGAFPVQYYMRNKKTNEIIHPKLLLSDYEGKAFFISPLQARISNFDNGVFFELDLVELKKAFAMNRLNGKLKELVATLNDDDNNVFMMVQF